MRTDNFKGVISAVYDGDAVIESYVDEDNSVITDETVAEVEEAVSDAVVNADGAWGQNGDLGNLCCPRHLELRRHQGDWPPLSSPLLIPSPMPLLGILPASWAPCTRTVLPPSCMTV